MLILPGDSLFDETLALAKRPDWHDIAIRDGDTYAMVAEPGSGLMRPVTKEELREYLNSGEYDERLKEIGEDENGVDTDFCD